ncbi:glutaminase A [Bacillus canaveralius]|uniref:glutaminase A n=1 Tax=Bacillus canaveralius TaxID=1403243 RepID=UPI000F784C59|nr:glutaminase A [Bacillus canaveralius]RSK53531.1 glutaminase A [Bacillus canaveralius]
MTCRSNESLSKLVEEARPYAASGRVADYIPALGRAEKDDLSVAIFDIGNEYYYAGDYKKKFTLQSISKVLALALALSDRGFDYVFSHVGMEPTGDPFNSISKLETSVPSKPLNPMINAGALAVTHMINGRDNKEKIDRIIRFVSSFLDGAPVTCNWETAQSEMETADLNRALCYFMKQHGIIEGDVEDLLRVYTAQCAIEMNCFDLARVGAVLALNGVDPETGKQIIAENVARICKTFMVTCGMYNASGEFAIKIGIPAKSGVSGGIMGAVPGRYGIGIFGPSLDEKGNSIAGMKILEMLAREQQLSIF